MSSPDVPRTVLPIPERAHVGLTTYDAKDPDTSYPPIEPVRPPAGAPNVLVWELYDTNTDWTQRMTSPPSSPRSSPSFSACS
jgi:hypothetical protein